jgi:general secretion pathway protein G
VKERKGYTLIEVLIVLAILSVMSMLAYPTYSKYVERVEIAEAESDLVRIGMVMETYNLSYGSYPPDLATAGISNIDPWGNPYQYLNMALTNGNGQKRKDHNQVPINTDFDLYSMGPDGRSVGPLTASHSRDDIIRANNGEYIGVASEY